MADKSTPIQIATIPASLGKFMRSDEELRLRYRQLPVPLVMHLAAMLGGLLAAIAVSQIPGLAAWTRPVAWILWIFLAARLVVAASSWPNYQIAVTNKRLLVVSGFSTHGVTPFPLPDFGEIGVRQSIRGRLIGYGTIIITPAGGTPSAFDYILYPQQLYLEFLNLDKGK
jgi:Bacterial PH domain